MRKSNQSWKSDRRKGEIDNFFGEEIIKNEGGEEIYKAKYMGGLVDKRKED